MRLTRAQLGAAMPHAPKLRLDKYYPFIVEAMEAGEINTERRIAHFLAQVGHESMDFKYLSEIWGPTPAQRRYGKRKDLGNTKPEAIAAAAAHGDEPGHFYMGHGALQDTGYDNHKAAGEYIGIDAVNHPELLAKPEYAFRAAEHFWTKNNLNRYADRDQAETLTRRVNGGVNGLEDRLARLATAKSALRSLPAEPEPKDEPDEQPTEPAASATEAMAQVEAAPAAADTTVQAAVTVPVPGGGPNDPAVIANEQPLWKKLTTWAGSSLSLGVVGDYLTRLTGLSEKTQLLVVGAIILGALIAGVFIGARHLLIMYTRSRADRINVR